MPGIMEKRLKQLLSLLVLLRFHCTADAFIHERHFRSHSGPEIKDIANSKYATNCVHLQTDTNKKHPQKESPVFEKYWFRIPAIHINKAKNSYGAKHSINLSHKGKKKMCHKKKMYEIASKNSKPLIYSDINELTLLQNSSLEILADFAIDILNQQIKREGNSKVKVPDINETFYEQIGPLKIKGEFNARNGWFHSLSTLYRTDKVHVSRGGNVLTVLIGVGLKEMMIDYKYYKLKFMGVGPRGKIEAQVSSNSIEMILTVDISDSRCKIKLPDIKITTFGGFKVNLTGLGRLSFFGSKVATWISDIFEVKIKGKAEKLLAKALKSVLDNVKC